MQSWLIFTTARQHNRSIVMTSIQLFVSIVGARGSLYRYKYPFFRALKLTLFLQSSPSYSYAIGEPVELRYALESHGISTDQIPITWTGKAKTSYTKQWFRIRHLLDECNNPSSIVECPKLNDVIFRQGTSTTSHPGNVLFRSRIQLFFEESEAHTTARSTRAMVSKLINDIEEKNGRVLVWYSGKSEISRNVESYWTELTDQAQVFTKIENLVREFKFSKGRHHAINRGESGMGMTGRGSVQVAESSTNLFLAGQKRTNCRETCENECKR
mmetsp:Transcript_29030/g.68221  ORF Transcript_29030/g.68221 Transcript_29030/m.68221 type:complete len:271 (-) Transcript_29030:122-934(-)